MFLNDSNENIIKYIKVPNEKTDKFALNMINNGNIKNLIVCGENNQELLFPISNLTPLKKHLGTCSFCSLLSILKEASFSEAIAKNYLLGSSNVVNQLSKSFVENGTLKLICIPTDFSSSYRIDNGDYLLSILGAWMGDESKTEYIRELQEIIIRGNDKKLLQRKIDELLELESENDEKNEISSYENTDKKPKPHEKKEKPQKKKRTIHEWFFGKEHIPPIIRNEDLPQEISVISVRGGNIEYPLAFGPDVIGSNENLCSIAFPNNNTVDGEHSRILFENGRYWLEDLNSTSGTYLNNERIEERKKTVLSPADLIKVGNVELVFSQRT